MAEEESSAQIRAASRTMEGYRLHLSVIGCGTRGNNFRSDANCYRLTFGLFLSALETTIVSTTLDTIAKHFDDEREYSWIVTAYMVTFNAQSMTQLIVFRAFQGLGASGLFSLTMVIVPDITPDRWLGLYSGVVSSVFAFSSVLGPVLGGVLAQHSTWRWVFLLKYVRIHGRDTFRTDYASAYPVQQNGWREIDAPGAFLFLAATIFLIYALQSASTVGDGNGWSSPAIIGCLVGSGVSLIMFIGSAFFMGSSFYSTIIQLPQRLQHVNDKSPTTAGVLLLPVLLPSAGFSALSGGLYRKFPAATPLLLFCGGVLQVIGVGLLSTLPTGSSVSNSQYGFEVMTGIGFGLMLPSFMILARDWVSEEQYVCGAILNKELDKASRISNIKSAYGDIYNEQFFVMASLSIPSALAAGIILMRQYTKKGVFRLAPGSGTLSS
uniref:Major facilitator superfamily (MFS) profile domain-containing protein n=1 Tax=Fusarium oxysporum (strain Fo5176) TaxID=660025 RepID=A0A0D2XFP8_FUSOF